MKSCMSTITVQEKLSLVSRFGVSIYFGSPDKKQFRDRSDAGRTVMA